MTGNIQEKNIRYFLKDIYNLYDKVTDLIFTTFYFDPDFFEENVVTFLMGGDKKISTIGELNDTNKWINEHGVCVYYDKGALISGSSCITLPIYPQHIETGVFHPKVIIIHGTMKATGKEATHIVVSSCNLTVSGYGRNREAFACTRIDSTQLANSLLEFINTISKNDVSRHKTVKSYLKKTTFVNKTNVEFFWNYGNQNPSLLSRLAGMPKSDMMIISPYFDVDGPEVLLKKMSNNDNITIIPAEDGENYNIYSKHYESLTQARVVFKTLAYEEKTKRFVHAKIMVKGKSVVIGSYNFTSAALERLNAEAALIFTRCEIPSFSTMPVDDAKFLPEGEPLKTGDTLEGGNSNIYVSVTVDWQLDKVIISTDAANNKSDYFITIDGLKNSPEWALKKCDEYGTMYVSLTESLSRAFLRHKQYSVYKKNTFCFKGLINEINWIGVRPEIGCESLDETLAEWYLLPNTSSKGSRYELRCITEEDASVEKILGNSSETSSDIFDNYYMASKALENLLYNTESNKNSLNEICTAKRDCPRRRAWIAHIEGARNGLYNILFSAPGSINQILKQLEKKEVEENFDVVYGWLICKYLDKALKVMPQKIEGLPIFAAKYKEVRKNLKEIESRVLVKLKAESSEEYIKWIDKELFRKEA